MLANLELEDVLRYRNEDIIEMTFVHSNGTHQARLDRFYVRQHILGQCDSLQTIPSLKVSDHEAIDMTYKDPIPRDRIEEPHYGLSRALLKAIANTESNLRWEIDRICNEGATQIRQAREEGRVNVAGKSWNRFKDFIRDHFKPIDDKYAKARKSRIKGAIDTIRFEKDRLYADQIKERLEAINYLKYKQEKAIKDIKMSSEFHMVRDGEHANKLFYQYVKMREKQNQVPHLRMDDDTLTATPPEKKQQVSDAYAKTFTKRTPDQAALNKVFSAKLPQHSKVAIDKFLDLESLDPPEEPDSNHKDWLVKAVESLKMYKAPGPDGIPNDFYYIMRENENLMWMLREVFKQANAIGKLPASMKTTYYKLLYKKGSYSHTELNNGAYDRTAKDLRNLSNWRPIALIPCDSKIFSAYVAHNLKVYIGDIISKSQSACVPGRSIHGNIMLVQQMIHYYNSTNAKAGLLFIDFPAAYDFISQEYIIEAIEQLEFPEKFVNVVKMMMKNQSGRVLVNGDLSPGFDVNNGGKHGDPLFPSIYIIAMEGFSALLEASADYHDPTTRPR